MTNRTPPNSEREKKMAERYRYEQLVSAAWDVVDAGSLSATVDAIQTLNLVLIDQEKSPND